MKLYFLILIFLVFVFNNKLKSDVNNLPHCDSKSIWKHAAYEKPTNSYIKNIRSNLNMGYCGIELDVIFDEIEKIIYISHDPVDTSYKKKILLSNVDQIIKDKKIYLWLDWKNANFSNLKSFVVKVEDYFVNYLSQHDSLIFIETPHVVYNEIMSLLIKNDNIKLLNWLSISSNNKSFSEKIKNSLRYLRAWFFVCVLPDKWISTPNVEILTICKNNFKTKSIFLFTINDLEKAKEAFSNGVNVILSDDLNQSQFIE